MAQHLLSLPPNLVDKFHTLTDSDPKEWFATSDPVGRKLGSGGGTVWLLEAAWQAEAPELTFEQWLAREQRILLHAGGQSRRLPAYAPAGKVLTPVPVFRWKRGQCIDQTLLSLQMPLYRQIMAAAPKCLRTLIASGDVFIRTTQALDAIPEADVVCYGLWVDPTLAKNHGVFMMNRQQPQQLDYMLQKPSTDTLADLTATHFFLMDIGVWLLSDRAVELLRARSLQADGSVGEYDLYGTFGCCMGQNPSQHDAELAQLSVAILPLSGGEFYHYGTSSELISSTTAIQNLIKDQRFIIQREVKQQPSVFTQNACVEQNVGHLQQLWIENSHTPTTWQLSTHHIITGVPHNAWSLHLTEGQCVDVVPIGSDSYAARPYGMYDAFRGRTDDANTLYLGQPITTWLAARQLTPEDIAPTADLQAAALFPVTTDIALLGRLLAWMLAAQPELLSDADTLRQTYLTLPRLSADALSDQANLTRLEAQRSAYRSANLTQLAQHHATSIFYQSDLKHMAELYVKGNLTLPDPLPANTPLMTTLHDAMFRSEVLRDRGQDGSAESDKAFATLAEGLTAPLMNSRQSPRLDVCSDQIVWGRCPVRIDLAGGWSDTPPYSLTTGGNVVNMGILLNGQPPLQVYIKPAQEHHIICRSIDLGATEVITTYDELAAFNKIGSPFSIPKAALALAGFLPQFSHTPYATLTEQLAAFGSGIEITLLSAIPAGSGLGTSSILAATVLGALSDFCALAWDRIEIGNRTLVLEQLLTTGGGWQDQYGGILPGVKLLQSSPGFDQTPLVRWLPDTLFAHPDYAPCHLLYYTGITRTAKHILAEIVRGMFLNSHTHLELLDAIKQHALTMHDALQRGNFEQYGRLIAHTWQQKQRLDAGTAPVAIQQLTAKIHDLCLGYKLPGAGGGGYLYMVAKDAQAAQRIRQILTEQALSPTARFVDLSLSHEGLQVSRS